MNKNNHTQFQKMRMLLVKELLKKKFRNVMIKGVSICLKKVILRILNLMG